MIAASRRRAGRVGHEVRNHGHRGPPRRAVSGTPRRGAGRGRRSGPQRVHRRRDSAEGRVGTRPGAAAPDFRQVEQVAHQAIEPCRLAAPAGCPAGGSGPRALEQEVNAHLHRSSAASAARATRRDELDLRRRPLRWVERPRGGDGAVCASAASVIGVERIERASHAVGRPGDLAALSDAIGACERGRPFRLAMRSRATNQRLADARRRAKPLAAGLMRVTALSVTSTGS